MTTTTDLPEGTLPEDAAVCGDNYRDDHEYPGYCQDCGWSFRAHLLVLASQEA